MKYKDPVFERGDLVRHRGSRQLGVVTCYYDQGVCDISTGFGEVGAVSNVPAYLLEKVVVEINALTRGERTRAAVPEVLVEEAGGTESWRCRCGYQNTTYVCTHCGSPKMLYPRPWT